MKQWENITIHGPNILFKNIMVYPIIFPSNIIINSLYQVYIPKKIMTYP